MTEENHQVADVVKCSRWYCYVISFGDTNGDGHAPFDTACAIGNMDGSWWVDWPQIEKMAAISMEYPDQYYLAIPKLLVAARGNFVEVSRERADEIALEAGKRGRLFLESEHIGIDAPRFH